VLEAFAWGLLAASSLLVGGAIALRVRLGDRLIGLVLGFGAGVLLSAVAYELVEEAFDMGSGTGALALGLPIGALTFYVGDALIDRMGGEHRKRPDRPEGDESDSALAIVLGIVLDGVPESIVLGLTLLSPTGVSTAMLAAVFVSNVPESVAATAGLRSGGWRPSRIMGLWGLVALVSGLAALVGYLVFEDASPRSVGFVDAFAAGAILTMLADTMMPEAFRRGGKTVGLVTTLGFGLAFAISTLE
jgi:ZIP family zinc transporter